MGALTSAVPALHQHTLALCLAILCVLTLANLRGTREASRLWAVPTYVFVASFLVLIALGLAKSLAAGGSPRPLIAPPTLPRVAESVSARLLLRAFASGCTAMTGVEAVSNAMDAFREPVVTEARRTLTAIVAILGCLLAVTAGLLLVAFGGITDRLIPLFAIGAFLTFTLSQAGMVGHWRRELRGGGRDRAHHRAQLAINATGTVATAAVLAIIIAAKFLEGAWITLLAIPLVLALLHAIRRYYDELARQLRSPGPLELRDAGPPIVLVAMESWNRLTDRAVSFALRLSPDVFAVHLTSLHGPDVEERKQDLLAEWRRDVEQPAREAGIRPPRLFVLDAPHRRMHVPLLELMGRIEKKHPGRTIAVLVPEIMKQRWWENLLHTHRARRLRSALLHYGGSRTLVVSVPWYLEEPRIEDAVEAARPAHRRA